MKKLINTKNIYGKKIIFSIDLILFHIIEEMKLRADNNLDNVIIISGSVGSGKSNIGDGIAGLWQRYFIKKEYTLNHVHFNANSVVTETDREDNEMEVIKFDEAVIGGSGRAVLTAEGNRLKEALITKRRKKHLWIFITDEIKELNSKIVSRCNLLIDVRYIKKTDKKGYRKGLYNIYNSNEANHIYELMKDKSIRFIKDYKTKEYKETYYCMNYKNIFFSEEDYDKKKIMETKQMSTNINNDKAERNNLVYYMFKTLKVKRNIIAKLIKKSPSTISEICNKINSE